MCHLVLHSANHGSTAGLRAANFYTQQHQYYCGVDLHARSMYVCILDAAGTVVVHKDLPAEPDSFLRVIAPYRDNLAVAVECIFRLGRRTAKQHVANAFYRLRSVPGIGKIIALVILYEIHDITRFPRVQDFASYCRDQRRARAAAGALTCAAA
ncbi:MAG: IS110 family transposase [Deltaproteobacteria bacterium]|nr:IS110 family transposase [Deltaproteobacteria bacterium]